MGDIHEHNDDSSRTPDPHSASDAEAPLPPTHEDIVRWRWASASRWLMGIAVVCVAVGLIYFFNGLTVPHAEATVALDSKALNPDSMAEGDLKEISGSATFRFWGVDSMADRWGLRLGVLATWFAAAFGTFALSRLFRARSLGRHFTHGHMAGPWRLAAAAALWAGLVLPAAIWAQGYLLLSYAGHPKGMTPMLELGWPWISLAAVCWAISGGHRTAKRGHADESLPDPGPVA